MPEYLFKTYNNDVSLLVWQVEETADELLKMLPEKILHDKVYASIAVPHLQLEFLAGRLVAQRICEQLNISYSGIIKDEHGKPHLADCKWEMSLTHSKDFVAIAVHPEKEVGVDIEKPGSKLRRIMPRLFSAKENKMVDGDLIKMSWFWSAKEALYKLYGKRGIDFTEHLFLDLNADSLTGEIRLPNRHTSHEFIIEKINDYYLVIAI